MDFLSPVLTRFRKKSSIKKRWTMDFWQPWSESFPHRRLAAKRISFAPASPAWNCSLQNKRRKPVQRMVLLWTTWRKGARKIGPVNVRAAWRKHAWRKKARKVGPFNVSASKPLEEKSGKSVQPIHWSKKEKKAGKKPARKSQKDAPPKSILKGKWPLVLWYSWNAVFFTLFRPKKPVFWWPKTKAPFQCWETHAAIF